MAWDDTRARTALRALFDAAVAAADPRKVLAAHLPPKPTRPLHRGRRRQVGRADGRRAGGRLAGRRRSKARWSPATATPCRPARIEVIEASHPVPDANSERGARRLLERVHGLGPDDLVLALMSGGGSALLRRRRRRA